MDPEFNSQELGQKIWILNGAERPVWIISYRPSFHKGINTVSQMHLN
jgi:hypothetical protein